MWVFQHFFADVQAIKPNSSRSQSAEIFVVCLKYNKPKKIDPKVRVIAIVGIIGNLQQPTSIHT